MCNWGAFLVVKYGRSMKFDLLLNSGFRASYCIESHSDFRLWIKWNLES